MQVNHVRVVADFAGNQIDYGYMYEFTSLAELLHYWTTKRIAQVSEGVKDYINSREFDGKDQHVSTDYGCILASMMHVEKLNEEPRSFTKVLSDLNDSVLMSMAQYLELDSIFVQHNGSYMPKTSEHQILSRHVSDSYDDFPVTYKESDIRVIKWPLGKHYYAKIKAVDVVLDGKQKWNTEEEARSAAVEYIRRKMQNKWR